MSLVIPGGLGRIWWTRKKLYNLSFFFSHSYLLHNLLYSITETQSSMCSSDLAQLQESRVFDEIISVAVMIETAIFLYWLVQLYFYVGSLCTTVLLLDTVADTGDFASIQKLHESIGYEHTRNEWMWYFTHIALVLPPANHILCHVDQGTASSL